MCDMYTCIEYIFNMLSIVCKYTKVNNFPIKMSHANNYLQCINTYTPDNCATYFWSLEVKGQNEVCRFTCHLTS